MNILHRLVRRPFRKLLWMIYLPRYVKVTEQQDSIIAYPLLIWLEFHGEKVFMEQGRLGFLKAIEEQTKLMVQVITEEFAERARLAKLTPEQWEEERVAALMEAADELEKEEKGERDAMIDSLIAKLDSGQIKVS